MVAICNFIKGSNILTGAHAGKRANLLSLGVAWGEIVRIELKPVDVTSRYIALKLCKLHNSWPRWWTNRHRLTEYIYRLRSWHENRLTLRTYRLNKIRWIFHLLPYTYATTDVGYDFISCLLKPFLSREDFRLHERFLIDFTSFENVCKIMPSTMSTQQIIVQQPSDMSDLFRQSLWEIRENFI